VGKQCGAAETEHACQLNWDQPGRGGEHVLHPDRPDVEEYLARMHGFDLRFYKARDVKVPELPGYVPQIRWRRSLAGHLKGPVYSLRPKAILDKGRIRTADEVRAYFELNATQQLVLILFDDDPLLEHFYDPIVAKQLAEAGYDLIVSASYSIWWPRPRMHQLYNLTRSIALCVTLQELGAPAIPRLDFVVDHDIERASKWINDNPSIALVGIDAQTSTEFGNRSWNQLLANLEQFDLRTGQRLNYLINGPGVEGRWSELFAALSPDRTSLTDASLHMGDKPTQQELLEFPGQDGAKVDWGLCLNSRVDRRESQIARLKDQWELGQAA
jgi:hypothetical protein